MRTYQLSIKGNLKTPRTGKSLGDLLEPSWTRRMKLPVPLIVSRRRFLPQVKISLLHRWLLWKAQREWLGGAGWPPDNGPFLGFGLFQSFFFPKELKFSEGKATERIFVCPSTQLQKSDSHQQQGRKTWHSTYYIMLYTVFDVNLHKVLHTSQYVIYGYMYIYIYIYFRFPIVAPFDWLFLMERVFITREVIPNFGRTGPLILIDLLKWHVNFQDEWNQNNKSCRVVPPEFPQ